MSKRISKMTLALVVAGSAALLAGTLSCGSADSDAPAAGSLASQSASESSASAASASTSRAAPGPGGAMSQDPVHWTAEIDEESLVAGGKVTVDVKATIDPGWYIYSITQGEGGPVPSRISLADEQPFTQAGDVKGTKPTVKFDQNFSMEVEMHEGSVAYELPVQVAADAGPDVKEIQVRARYQACTNRVCLPAQTEKLSVPVTITPSTEG